MKGPEYDLGAGSRFSSLRAAHVMEGAGDWPGACSFQGLRPRELKSGSRSRSTACMHQLDKVKNAGPGVQRLSQVGLGFIFLLKHFIQLFSLVSARSACAASKR